jgi:hypothetical protein
MKILGLPKTNLLSPDLCRLQFLGLEVMARASQLFLFIYRHKIQFSPSLKGQCHEMDFLRSKDFIQYFICDGFQGLSTAFHYPLQLLTFYLIL